MPRLFVALTLPESLAERLTWLQGGIPGARWESADKLHMTLQFLGAVEHGVKNVGRALEQVRMEPFHLQLAGVGHFPPRGEPRSIWVGVRDPKRVTELHARVTRVLESVGVDLDRRRFAPHVTLARLHRAPEDKVVEFLRHHALFEAEPFVVQRIVLMSSVLGPGGSKYRIEQSIRLRTE